MRILLVEDDALLPQGLREALEQVGFQMDHLEMAELALEAIAHGQHDLAIVDLGLPGMDGLELVRRVRASGHRLPILILSARDGLADRVGGLHAGADDYLMKPFLLPELLARVQALIRRSQSVTSSRVVARPLVLDMATHEAQLHGALLPLTGREWALLQTLALAMPKVVAKRKLADSGVIVRTVRGIGYRLDV